MSETINQVLDSIEDETVPVLMPAGANSLDFLQAVYRDPYQPMHRRMRAAVAALSFEHPKLAVTAVVNGEGFAAKLEAARNRAAKVTGIRANSATGENAVAG